MQSNYRGNVLNTENVALSVMFNFQYKLHFEEVMNSEKKKQNFTAVD